MVEYQYYSIFFNVCITFLLNNIEISYTVLVSFFQVCQLRLDDYAEEIIKSDSALPVVSEGIVDQALCIKM